jgi:hypothetical protein
MNVMPDLSGEFPIMPKYPNNLVHPLVLTSSVSPPVYATHHLEVAKSFGGLKAAM